MSATIAAAFAVGCRERSRPPRAKSGDASVSPSARAAPELHASTSPALSSSAAGPEDGPREAPCQGFSVSIDTAIVELRRRAVEEPCTLGSVSIGRPNDGALLNPSRLTEGDAWVVAYPDNAWATSETLDCLRFALRAAQEGAGAGTDAPKVYVGDLSTRWGGPLPPHASHQNGRDADVGYFRVDARDPWWADASARTLDVTRTWAFVRALESRGCAEAIFVDRAVQHLVMTHAARVEGPRVRRLFDLGAPSDVALVRHVPGHLNHMHVRFKSRVAERVGGAVQDLVAGGRWARRPPHGSD